MGRSRVVGKQLKQGQYESAAGEFRRERRRARQRRDLVGHALRCEEALGRKSGDRVIMESHLQLDGFTFFARGARAILDADRNLEGGRHEAGLERIFQRRKIGPL